MKVALTLPGGRKEEFELPFGSMRRIELGVGEVAEAIIEPASGFDVGAGKGHNLKTELAGGVAGLIFDCRGRQPFALPKESAARIGKLIEWCDVLGVYPEAFKKTAAPIAVA